VDADRGARRRQLDRRDRAAAARLVVPRRLKRHASSGSEPRGLALFARAEESLDRGPQAWDVLQQDVPDDLVVAWAGERKPDAKTGKLPPVGNTVDVANANWTNTIGSPELNAVWKDPDFDLALRAFYYARVIEIPTPRWTAFDARRFGIQLPKDVPMTLQERAYTSPIWYTPAR
jgi:hypothetical protein